MSIRSWLVAFAVITIALPILGTAQEPALASVNDRSVQAMIDLASEDLAEVAADAVIVASELTSDRRVTFPVTGKTQVLEVPSAGAWRLCLAAAGLWSPCRTVAATTTTVSFPVWPAASLVGRLRFADRDGDPQALKVTVGPPPGPGPAGPLEDTQLSCELDEEAAFVCPLPATESYVAVRVSGFVSRYFWNLVPKPAAIVDLGTIRLEPGASLSGTVDLAAEGLDPERISTRLVPALSGRVPPDVAARVEKDTKTSRIGPHGFFQFGDVKPGMYMLEVSHAAFATSRLGPFEVFPGRETELRAPVTLQPPVDLDLFVTPALSPQARPWRVHVFRARDWSAGSDQVFRGEADAAGRLQVRGQSPGSFRVAITDELGNRFHSQEVRIDPGESGFVPVDVPIVEVRGTLRLGGDPVAGTLLFGGHSGSLRARMSADDEGRFTGAVGRDGEWEVEVNISDPPVSTVRRIEVVAGADRVAEIDVELADTELVGRVVDDTGRPVAEAEVKVTAVSELVHIGARTDANGGFSFRALPEGPATVGASSRSGDRVAVSVPLQISIQEDLPMGPVELVLRQLESIAGEVSSSLGPVPGARVHVATLDLPTPAADMATSGVDGRFAVRVPESAGLLAVTVLPPGGFLTTAVLPAQAPLDLQTAMAGGDLLARFDSGEDGADHHLWIEREGVLISPAILREWARGHGIQTTGSRAHYPRLAEGRYRICAVLRAERREGIRRGANWQQVVEQATRCTDGLLTAGGTLDVTIE